MVACRFVLPGHSSIVHCYSNGYIFSCLFCGVSAVAGRLWLLILDVVMPRLHNQFQMLFIRTTWWLWMSMLLLVTWHM